MTFEPKTWRDYPNTTTPLTADELNRLEQGISDASDSVHDTNLSEILSDTTTRSNKAVYDATYVIPDNLFNLKTATFHHRILSGQGDIEPSTSSDVSNWVRVSPGEDYTLSPYTTRITYYNSSREFVSNTVLYRIDTITVPSGVAWMRLTTRVSDRDIYQINPGTEVLPYSLGADPYIPSSNLQLPPELNTSVVKHSKNLINTDKSLEGYAIPPIIGASDPVEDSRYSVSDFIPADPEEEYWFTHATRLTYFDENYDFVWFYTLNSHGAFNPDLRAAVRYLRVTYRTEYKDKVIMIKGSESDLEPYEPFWVEVDGAKIPGEVKTPSVLHSSPYLVDTLGLMGEYTAPTIDAQPELGSTTTSDVYGWYDQLASEFPDYVTPNNLGPSSSDDPMYSYTLKSPSVSPETEDSKPVAILLSGIHGYEKASVYNLWRIASELCHNWAESSVLEALRWNVHLEIIPVGSPYGYDHSIRTNMNGVDINRNFPSGWRLGTPETVTYGGPEPLSEPETQAIYSVMNLYKDRALLGADFHNTSTSTERPHGFIWVPSRNYYNHLIATRVLQRLSRKWKKERTWVTDPSTYYGSVDMTGSGGTASSQFLHYSIPGSTFEVSRLQRLDGGEGIVHSSEALTLGVEALVHYISMSLKYTIDSKNVPRIE